MYVSIRMQGEGIPLTINNNYWLLIVSTSVIKSSPPPPFFTFFPPISSYLPIQPFSLSPDLLSPPELIIMSDGENIPPVPIENRIKNEIPFLSHVMVVGDQRNFLTCLMTLKVNFHICISKKCYFNHILVTSVAFLLCASHVKFKECI